MDAAFPLFWASVTNSHQCHEFTPILTQTDTRELLAFKAGSRYLAGKNWERRPGLPQTSGHKHTQ